MKRRERRFEKEEWKHPGLELPEETRDGIRRVLGFFIGESRLVDRVRRCGRGRGRRLPLAATGPP